MNILESESDQKYETDKFNRVDLLIEDSHHRKIIIEIQNTRQSDYLERILYGTSKVIVENLKLGKRYKEISKVISVSILYFNLGLGDDYIYYGTTEFKGMNTGTPLIVKEKIEKVENYEPKIKFIEKKIFPEYYLITVERYKNIVRKRIDEWIYMIKNNEVKKDFTSKNIDKAEKRLSELNMSKEERKRYERYLDSLAIEKDALETAEEKGIDKGRKEGEKKGRKERDIEIAIEMIKDGESDKKITRYTGIIIEEIKKLRKKLEEKN
ncbi:MAG: PD-(D/E)XK nuclease family transposase [Bacteroidota bacterium]|nr:PD-(D/E)XK nuclease family transposase [Bacteroidota bacterium]